MYAANLKSCTLPCVEVDLSFHFDTLEMNIFCTVWVDVDALRYNTVPIHFRFHSHCESLLKSYLVRL